jgi:hypothetical protein
VYEAVPDDPQQMYGRGGNRTLYYVRHNGVFRSVKRERYYENKHPYYQRGEALKNLLEPGVPVPL